MVVWTTLRRSGKCPVCNKRVVRTYRVYGDDLWIAIMDAMWEPSFVHDKCRLEAYGEVQGEFAI